MTIHHTITQRLPILTMAALVLAVAVSCTAPATEVPEVELESDAFVGAVDDDLFVAVVVADHPSDASARVVVTYLCDGADVSRWLVGTATDDAVVLSGDGVDVSLLLGPEAVTGEVEFEGSAAQPFTAAAAIGDAGLYRAEAFVEPGDTSSANVGTQHYVGGWIILNNMQQRGAVAFGGTVTENPTLDPATRQATTAVGTLTAERRICITLPGGIRVCLIF